MPFKPNYRHDRAERDRNKQAKKLEKLRAKEEQAVLRRGAEGDSASESGEAAGGDASQPMKGEADALGARQEED